MNIVIIPSWYPSESNEQLGSFFREQALAVLNSGHNVFILDATIKGKKSCLDKKNFKYVNFNDNGLDVHSFTTSLFGLGRIRFIRDIVYRLSLKKIFKKVYKNNKIDIIHAHCVLPAGYEASKISKKYNIPLIVTEHSSGVLNMSLSKVDINRYKVCSEVSQKIICVSEALKKSVDNIINNIDKIVVIPNLVDKKFKFKPLARLNDEFVFFSAGNLQKSKNFDITIKAFSKAFKGNIKYKLKIAGMGSEKSNLQKLVHKLDISNQVVFLSRLSRDKMAEMYTNCNVFVLPSRFETFGVVYIEALACGRPVIAYKNGGANEIVNAYNGILLNDYSVESVSLSMKNIVNNYERYDKEKISNDAIDKYYKNVINDINNIYSKAVSIYTKGADY